MIFVTVGTHPGQFERLIRKIDELAPKINEEIIVQRGSTKYIPKNCKSFTFTSNIDNYFKKARLAINHAGASAILEYAFKYEKPLIIVPRQKKYGEHIDNHQVEFGEYFSEKTGALLIKDIKTLTPEILNSYRKKVKISKSNLNKFKKYFKLFIEHEKSIRKKQN